MVIKKEARAHRYKEALYDFRKTFMLLWIGHTRLILYAAYQCME
jgi:hypothetical protein